LFKKKKKKLSSPYSILTTNNSDFSVNEFIFKKKLDKKRFGPRMVLKKIVEGLRVFDFEFYIHLHLIKRVLWLERRL
jgi:hypothetical protein